MPWGSVVSKCPQTLGLYLSARGLLANERVWQGGLSTLSLFYSFISLLLVFLQLDYIQSFDIKVGWGSPGFGDTDLKKGSRIQLIFGSLFSLVLEPFWGPFGLHFRSKTSPGEVFCRSFSGAIFGLVLDPLLLPFQSNFGSHFGPFFDQFCECAKSMKSITVSYF